MILIIGGIVITVVIGIIVYFVFFNKSKKEKCIDDGNIWTIDEKCLTPKQVCTEAGSTWTEDNVCKTPKEVCEIGTDNTWENDICKTPRDICENKSYTWSNGECFSPQAYCENNDKYWSDIEGCITQDENCTSKGMTWSGGKCKNTLSIQVKGLLGGEQIILKTQKGNIKSIIPDTTIILDKIGIVRTFILDNDVTDFIIDYTNDLENTARDVILTELKLNGVDIMGTLKQKDTQSPENMTTFRSGLLGWKGEYVYPITVKV
jgi:hypothetical protein